MPFGGGRMTGVPCEPPIHAVRDAVGRALAEDLTPLGDVTAALLDPTLAGTGAFVARQAGRLAGMSCVREAFGQVDATITLDVRLTDGAPLEPGTVIAQVDGPLAGILTAERTALNFLCHLSGVASLTARYVGEAQKGGPAQVWDTRKTTPGLRTLEKAAVRAGGGRNHRGNLSDWVLLKDNHITGIGITEAIRRARDMWPARTVHIECDHLDQVAEAAEVGATAILLDNMSPDQVRDAVALIAGRCLIEVTGGITLDTIAEYAACDVDLISVSRITQSAPALDIGLDVVAGDVPGPASGARPTP
jgi:nicotinate-nucleotide pyrophosphorylase (carboxylating)